MTCVSPDRISPASIFNDPGYGGLKDDLLASTGLAFYADRDEQLSALIGARISGLGLAGCSSYAQFLADGVPGIREREVLIGHLTIGETYFFRDDAQFAAIRDIVIPDILRRNRPSMRLRIWSAGCATGAEPYSLAILLTHEMADLTAGWEIAIHATDLNRDYLAQAEEGRFREWALRGVSDAVKSECFSKKDGLWAIHPRFQKCISFHHLNLAESELSTPFEGPFDLILCRNVMIYFAADVNRRLIGKFHDSLTCGGWLAVGAFEHGPSAVKTFQTVDVPGARVYQKVTPAPAPAPEPVRSEPAPGKPRQTAPERVIPPKPIVKARSQQPRAPAPSEAPPDDIETLRQLADRGDWKRAAEYGQRLLAQDRLNPAAHYYLALVFENLGMVAESERSLRQAIYLDRKFALAHYHLGLALKRSRQMNASARSFANVLKALAALPDHATVTAGPGISATELKELAKMHLENAIGL